MIMLTSDFVATKILTRINFFLLQYFVREVRIIYILKWNNTFTIFLKDSYKKSTFTSKTY